MADTRTATGVCYTMSGSEKRYENKISIEIVKGTTTLPTIKNSIVDNENHYSFDADENCVYKSKGEKDETLPLIFVTYYPNKGQNPVYFNYNQYCTVKIKVNLVMPRTEDGQKYKFLEPESVKIYYSWRNNKSSDYYSGYITLKDCYSNGIKVPYNSSLVFGENCINIGEAGESIGAGNKIFTEDINRLKPNLSYGEYQNTNSIIEYNIRCYNKYNNILFDTNKFTQNPLDKPNNYNIGEIKEKEVNLYVGFSRFFIQPVWGIDNKKEGVGVGVWPDNINCHGISTLKSTAANAQNYLLTHGINMSKTDFGIVGGFRKSANYWGFYGAALRPSIYLHYIENTNPNDNMILTRKNAFRIIPVSNGSKDSFIQNNEPHWETKYRNCFAHSLDDCKYLFREYDENLEWNGNKDGLDMSTNMYTKISNYTSNNCRSEFGDIAIGNIICGDEPDNVGGRNLSVVFSPTYYINSSCEDKSFRKQIPKYGIILGIRQLMSGFIKTAGFCAGQLSVGGAIAKPWSLTGIDSILENIHPNSTSFVHTVKYGKTDDIPVKGFLDEYKYGGMLIACSLPGNSENYNRFLYDVFCVDIKNSEYNLKNTVNWDYQPHTDYV